MTEKMQNILAAYLESLRARKKWSGSRQGLHQETCCHLQGDQIGRIFAYWAVIYFGQFLENSSYFIIR
jgi:hypothetical protein